jgi:hypothetical protein
MALGVSLNLSFSLSPCVVCWNYWTHHDVTLCLVQNGVVLRRVSSHTLHAVGVIWPLELRKVTGRRCYWPGLEASLESAMGPWNFSPARYKGSLILGLLYYLLPQYYASRESRGSLPSVTIGRGLLLRHHDNDRGERRRERSNL